MCNAGAPAFRLVATGRNACNTLELCLLACDLASVCGVRPEHCLRVVGLVFAQHISCAYQPPSPLLQMAFGSSRLLRHNAFSAAHAQRTPTHAHVSPRRHAASPLAARHTRTVQRRTRAQARPVQAAAAAEVGKLISQTEIPAFIPRQDLMDQLLRWASTEVQEEGRMR